MLALTMLSQDIQALKMFTDKQQHGGGVAETVNFHQLVLECEANLNFFIHLIFLLHMKTNSFS